MYLAFFLLLTDILSTPIVAFSIPSVLSALASVLLARERAQQQGGK